MKRISIVIPCFNEESVLPALFDRLENLARSLPGFAWEFVCVNDGSQDGTLAHLLAQQARSSGPEVIVVDLSRNFGKEAALTAGLATATGDAVIPFDADLQDPPDVIPKLIELWQGGNDVVLARRSDRDSDHWLKRITARLFYRFHNAVSDVTIPPDVGDFRLMDRMVVDVVNALPENRRFMKGLFAWAGFRTAAVDYSRAPRSGGRSSLGGRALWHLAVEGITSFSLTPLRIASVIGVLVASVSLGYGVWIVARTFIFGVDVPGYASIFTAVLFLGGLQLVCLGILGEYLGRAFLEAKRRPSYVIRSVHRGKPA